MPWKGLSEEGAIISNSSRIRNGRGSTAVLAIKAFLMDIRDLGLEHGDLQVVLLTERWLSHLCSRFSCWRSRSPP